LHRSFATPTESQRTEITQLLFRSGSQITKGLSLWLDEKRGSRQYSIVVPLKITTRERIVQPFAHQRILDGRFGAGRYRSMILCVSETQLDAKTSTVKQICVPGTIKLFQRYLASVEGLYYADPPARYLHKDVTSVITVGTVGDFFHDLLSNFS
ncbi:hypothetical protein, partial [Brevundimonas sp. TWP2-3-2]